MIECEIEISDSLLRNLEKSQDYHLKAMLIQSFVDGKTQKPEFEFGNTIKSDGSDWLLNLVAKSTGYSNSMFGGVYKNEFEYLSGKNIRLIDFNEYRSKIKNENSHAISRTRYGYDDDDEEIDDDDPFFSDSDWDIDF